MTFKMGVDVGGTFTDIVCLDETGEMNAFKSSTTPDNVVNGVMNTLQRASAYYKMPLKKLMANTDLFVYGSTVGTNAILQRRGGKVGLICTRGFKNILTFREAGKQNPLDFSVDYPEPYVPQYLTLPVTERINSEGGVETPLNEDEVRTAIARFRKWKVEAVAVCLLWSTINPVHEKGIGQIIQQEAPGLPYSLSHVVNPSIREYRRACAASIDASLKPIMVHSMSELRDRLKEAGFKGTISPITSSGGQTGLDEIINKPILALGSGPTMGPLGAMAISENDLGITDKLMVMDMGGTSFDVSLVREGTVVISRESQVAGLITGIPQVDIKSIGAGGGSIARVDPAGMIFVGPDSAAALPGPACYMRGGAEPTVTDANLVRGFLGDSLAGGIMKINRDLAEKVITEKIAKPANISLLDAAFSIGVVCEQNMVGAIQDITSRIGVDPREYLPVWGGSASGIHAIPICRELGMKRMIIPRTAGALCALGAVVSDCKADFSFTLATRSSEFNYAGVAKVLKQLESKADKFLARMGFSPENRQISFTVEARYPYQVWELEVPMRRNRIQNESDLTQLTRDFHDTHQRHYLSSEPGQQVEFLQWSSHAIGKMPKIVWKKQRRKGTDPSAALKTKRSAFFKELGGPVETPVYAGEMLAYGNVIEGPAIVDEPLTTVVVYPGCKATITQFGNYLIDVDVVRARRRR